MAHGYFTKKLVASLRRVAKITAHVPVDRFEIVNGPKEAECRQMIAALVEQHLDDASGEVNGVYDFLLTLKTGASTSTFKRILEVFHTYELSDERFSFRAYFNGHTVSGLYDLKARRGEFSPED